jgi:hypothetical protein
VAGKSGKPWPRCECGSTTAFRDSRLCSHHFRRAAEEFARELEDAGTAKPTLELPRKPSDPAELLGVAEWLVS